MDPMLPSLALLLGIELGGSASSAETETLD